ncbi:MAG: LysM peptidoglycan-binding domain-containing protein [Gemmatimonadetes bacterium]|nr:LysM peptidoglycan-binding domain-containing protein [Gemmatimonadota bacterium]
MKYVAWIAAGLCAAAPLAAQERAAEQVQERTHVVRPGDTLWDLARTYLNDPFLWPEIFRLNTDVVQNPARIFPAERLRLPGAGIVVAGAEEPGRTIFFPRDQITPDRELHTVRAAGTANVPVLTPGDFYRAGFLALERDVRPVGQIAERIFPSVVTLELPSQIQLYDKVFITLADAGTARIGDRLQFYRPGRAVRQHGRIFEPTGIATIAALDGNVATAVIVQVFDAVTVGDLAFPVADFPVPPGVSPIAATGLEGTILAFQNPHALQATQGIAFLNLGEGSGVGEGDEFVAYRPAQRRRWGTRPEVEVARLQVVRSGERTAAARVLSMDYPALEPGLAVRLVARMP